LSGSGRAVHLSRRAVRADFRYQDCEASGGEISS
jgi:hypothetical protein